MCFFYIYIFLRIIHTFTGSGEHSPLAIDGLNGHFAWLASIFNRLSQQNQGSDCVSVPPIRSCKAKTSCGPKFMTLTYSSNGLKAMLKMALLTELALMPLWKLQRLSATSEKQQRKLARWHFVLAHLLCYAFLWCSFATLASKPGIVSLVIWSRESW